MTRLSLAADTSEFNRGLTLLTTAAVHWYIFVPYSGGKSESAIDCNRQLGPGQEKPGSASSTAVLGNEQRVYIVKSVGNVGEIALSLPLQFGSSRLCCTVMVVVDDFKALLVLASPQFG